MMCKPWFSGRVGVTTIQVLGPQLLPDYIENAGPSSTDDMKGPGLTDSLREQVAVMSRQ